MATAAPSRLAAARDRVWYFVICPGCYWCASCIKSRFIKSCPACGSAELSRMDVFYCSPLMP